MAESPGAHCQSDEDDDAGGDRGGSEVPFLTLMRGQKSRIREGKQAWFCFVRQKTTTDISKTFRHPFRAKIRLIANW